MKVYDAYLFDWDGTIAQSLGVWLPLVRELLASYHIELSDKDIVRKIFGRARVGLPEVGVPEADLPEFFRKLDAQAAVRIPQAPLYPGIAELFAVLRSHGKKLAVITATIRPVMRPVLKSHGLEQTFDVVVTGNDIQNHKPDPEGVLIALSALGTPKDHAVMLGDSEKDILAGRNAGIDSILFYPPEHELFHNLAELQADKPTYTIHSWQELTDTIQ